MKKLISFGVLLASTTMAVAPANAVSIILNNIGGVDAGTNAFNGFRIASRFWETVLTNDVTLRLDVGYGQLPPNVLGSTGSTRYTIDTASVIDGLKATGNSELDRIAARNLPTLDANGGVSVITQAPLRTNGSGASPTIREFDADGSVNNTTMAANSANLKAIGFENDLNNLFSGVRDGVVTFSNQFAFDFDPTNGIERNQIDFIGVAIHEIGHALGFVSGVDTYDINTQFAGNLDNFATASIWDLFRYSQNPDGLDGGGPKLDWSIGGNPYFSIDGGETVYEEGFLSTGRTFGDRQQASHWKDNTPGQPQLGILDPTVAFGQQSVVDALDLAAYDAMGWNVALDVMRLKNLEFSTRIIPGLVGGVPEPTSWAMMIAGFGLVGGAMRRRVVKSEVSFA